MGVKGLRVLCRQHCSLLKFSSSRPSLPLALSPSEQPPPVSGTLLLALQRLS